MVDLTGRDFLKLLDYTPEEILYLLHLAERLKKEKKAGSKDGNRCIREISRAKILL